MSLPSDALAAVIVMDSRRLNLVFSSPMERDESGAVFCGRAAPASTAILDQVIPRNVKIGRFSKMLNESNMIS